MPSSTTASGPRIDKPAPSVEWRFTHRWGPQLGDVRDYTVRRRGDRVFVTGHSVDLSLDLELAAQLGDAIQQAAAYDVGSIK